MKKQLQVILFSVCLVAMASAQNPSNPATLRPFNGHTPSNPCNGNPCDINYNGGPVIETPPTVYIIYYGNWTTKDKSIIDYFFSHLSHTTMEKINTTYSDSSNKFVKNALLHNAATDDYHDNYSLGHNLSAGDPAIHTIIRNAINGGHLPTNTNGIYFVLTAKDVQFPGMCVTLCGYHSPATDIVSGDIIRYSMVGNPAICTPSQGQCEASKVIGDGTKSPNNDPGADGTVNVMWHEFSESSSDPEVNLKTAWAGNFCGESGDCCAWLFGNTKVGSNGAHYNETIGTKNFLTQMMLELKTTSRQGSVPAECENVWVKP